MTENELGKIIVDAAVDVHRELGPGLLESVYETVLAGSLQKKGCRVKRQVPVSIEYDGLAFDGAFRVDLLVEDRLVVEIKSVELLLNFSEATMKDGIRRLVNNYRPED